MTNDDLGWGTSGDQGAVRTPVETILFPVEDASAPMPPVAEPTPSVPVVADEAAPAVGVNRGTIVENITGRSGFDAAVLDVSTRRALAGLVTIEPPTAVVIVSDQPDLGREAALVLARAWDVAAQKSDPAVMSWPGPLIGDISVCATANERWSRDELDEQVLDKVGRMPVHRHIMIIESAADMDLRASERLLKTLEEPMSPVTFILVVENELALVNTIRGRMEHLVRVTPAPRDERIAALVRTGVPYQTAQTAVALAGRAVSLTDLIVADTEVEQLARQVFDAKCWGAVERPVDHAFEMAARITHLAACWESAKYLQSPKTVTPAVRARARILVRLGLELYRASAMETLRDEAKIAGGVLSPEHDSEVVSRQASFRGVELRLLAVQECETQMRTYASLNLVLSALFIAAGSEA